MEKKQETWITTFIVLILTAIFFGVAWYAYDHYVNRGKNVYVNHRYLFGDDNNTHLKAAREKGIKPPTNRDELDVSRLVKIKTCNLYKVDPLEYSVPYLTPAAKALLDEIGSRFQTAMSEQGLRKHRIVVTSVLRTDDDVNRLRKTNGNATKNSAHRYATTFDITYVRFNRMSLKGQAASSQQMANILGEVLAELRKEGRCYVRYERLEPCYHITSRR